MTDLTIGGQPGRKPICETLQSPYGSCRQSQSATSLSAHLEKILQTVSQACTSFDL